MDNAGGAKNLGGLIARDLRGKARKQWRSTTTAQAENQKPTLLLPPSRPQARAVAIQAYLTTAGAVEKLFASASGAFLDQIGSVEC